MTEWAFLTNHARVLVLLATVPGIRQRDICQRTDLTAKTINRIMADLCEASYVTRHRVGIRNFYEVHPDLPLRGDEDGRQVGDLLRLFGDPEAYAGAASR